MLFLLTFFVLDLYAALVLTDVGFVSLASLPVSEQPPILAHPSMAQPNIVQLVTTTVPLFLLPLPNGKKSFSKHQWRKASRRPMSMCARWMVLTELPTLPVTRKQKAVTTLLRDAIQIRDIAVPIVARASRILGPISRHLMEQIIPMICEAARASCPGFAVGILRVLCNGMCKAKRLHVDNEDQTCRVRCPMNQIVFSTTSALSSLTSSFRFGETLGSTFEKVNCFTTSSLKPF